MKYMHTNNVANLPLVSILKRANWVFILINTCLISLVILSHVKLYQYGFDDAYIHFRVARNLIETGAPYFNLGEAVKVSTSSGWTVFLALLYMVCRLLNITELLPLMVSIFNIVFTVFGMLIYIKILEILTKTNWSLPLKVIFQVTYLALILPVSIGLMETPLALLTAGLGIYLLLQLKPYGFTFLGITAYLRIELVFLLFVFFLIFIVQKKLKPLYVLGYSALGFIPFVIYDLYFFHTIIPQSIIAKSKVYSLDWFPPFSYIIYNSFPWGYLDKRFIGFVITGTLFVSVVVITGLNAVKDWRDKNIWPMALYFWGLSIIALYTLSKAYIFDWYIPLYTVPFLVLLYLDSYSQDPSRKGISWALLTGLFLIAVFSLTNIASASIANPANFRLFSPGARVKTYLTVGKLLYGSYPEANLLTSEIGGLGYSFNGRIIDAAGLASPDSLKFHPLSVPDQRSSGDIGAIPPGYVKEKFPELIVSYDNFSQALRADKFIDNYNLISFPAFLPQDEIYSGNNLIWGSRYLRVYIRKDLPVTESVYAFLK